MAILVDDPIWPWRGRRWAHLVSDVGIDELHVFAADLGLRRMGFQGDHYDVPAETRDRALAMGAEAVGGRELLGRLKAAGLRLAPGRRPGSWEEVGRWRRLEEVDGVPAALLEALDGVGTGVGDVEISAWRRGDEVALVVSAEVPIGFDPSVGVEHRLTDGDRLLELLAQR